MDTHIKKKKQAKHNAKDGQQRVDNNREREKKRHKIAIQKIKKMKINTY